MHFLDRMTLRSLLAALVAVAVALLLLAGSVYVTDQYGRWKAAEEASDFVNVIIRASNYMHETQRERGLSAGFLAGANTLDALRGQRVSTDAAVAALEGAGAAWRGIGREEVGRILASLGQLRDLRVRVETRADTPAQAAATYTAIIATSANALSATGATLAASSENVPLITATFAYMDLEWAKEFHGRERAQTNAILGAGAMSSVQRDLLMGTRAMGRNALDLVRAKSPEVTSAIQGATSDSEPMVTRYRDAVTQGNFDSVQPTAWWDQITAHMDGLWSVMEVQAEQIRSLALADANVARNLFVWAVLVGAAGILLFGGLAWIVAYRLNRALSEMRQVIIEVESSGDFSKRMSYACKDEVGQAATAFNSLLTQFATIIREVQLTGEAIAGAASEMAASGKQVTESSSAQSAAASSVAAAMEETSVSISETASNAQIADEVVARARGGIDQALATMRETVANVETVAGLIRNAGNNVRELDEGSKKIGGIVQVIKGIAEQTNLLALNAAIEAARAGEQGRGFAVVADEVRKLAERTSQATGEIAGLICSIQTQVDSTVGGIRDANIQTDQSLEMVANTEVALRLADEESATAAASVRIIADAVREQDAAVQQVADNIEKIAQMTEENSAAAQVAATTALRLDELSGKLRGAVERYRT
ncbi:MAG: methyl-accepting chemotaxis protein [Azoarcus sp.]|nr:methyl-accepting chemotaxis protein [Azoarcus sp.]